MKVLDLFSGIGGFSLGLERAGMETVAFCESDEFCRKVLNKNWPDVPVHNDIKELDGKNYDGTVGLVCGGFPCQPFSVAGRRQGKNDDRHLWPEMFRVIREVRPRWVIGENVFGFINLALDDVQSDLEKELYQVGKFVLPAVAVDAKHRRDRIFIVASRHETVADTQHEGPQGGLPRGTNPQRESELGHVGCRRPVHRQPRQKTWAIEPKLGRVASGIPDRVDRIRALGNAVVPQVAEEIGRLILACEAAK